MPKAFKPLLTGALIAGLAVLPALAQDKPSPDVTAETVVATVNGTEITIGHMIMMRSRLPEEYRQLPTPVLYRAILDQMVQQTLLAQSFEGERPAYIGLSLDNEERNLLAGRELSRFVKAAVTDETVAARYAEKFTDADQTEFNASHILVETEEAALEAVADLDSGKAFAAVAKERSTGPSGPNGGSLGWFSMGQMVPEFEAAVLEMAPGDVSAPVETQFGWHVIKLNDTRPVKVPTLDEARSQIIEELHSEAIATRLGALREAAEITRVEPDEIDTDAITDASLVED